MIIGKEYIAICGDAGDGAELFDVAELVRCKDCIYYDKKKLGFRKCTQSGFHVTYEDYCSYGERTEE